MHNWRENSLVFKRAKSSHLLSVSKKCGNPGPFRRARLPLRAGQYKLVIWYNVGGIRTGHILRFYFTHKVISVLKRRVWEAAPYERISDFVFLIGGFFIESW